MNRELFSELEQRVAERTAELTRANVLLQQQLEAQRRIETSLRESETYYHNLFDKDNDVHLAFTLDGTIINVNREAERILGWPRQELLGQTFHKIAPPASVALAVDLIRRALAGEQINASVEVELVRRDGSVFPVEARSRFLRDSEGKPIGFQAIYRDLTERKQAEEALRAAKEYAETLIESSLDMIIAVDADRRIVEFNHAAEHTFGYGKEEVVGRSVGMLYADQAEGLLVHGAALHGDAYTTEIKNRRKNGEVFDSFLAVSVLRDTAGQTIGLMGISRDITDRKRAEEALRRSHEELERRVAERTAELVATNALLHQEIAERTHAEEALRQRMEEEQLLTKISTTLLSLPREELDNGITEALRALGAYTGADRSYMFTFSDDGVTFTNTHEWCASGIEPQIQRLQNIPLSLAPWFVESSRQGRVWSIPSVADLPNTWAEKKGLQEQGIQSLIAVFMQYRRETMGMIGFDAVRERKAWSDETVALLVRAADILTNVWQRKRAEDAMREREANFRILFATNPHSMWVYDPNTLEILEVNDAAVAHYGYTRQEFLGLRVTDLRPPEEVEPLLHLLRQQPEGLRRSQHKHRVKGGRIIDVEVVSHSLGFAGRTARVVVANDITERIQLQEQLVQHARLAALGRITGDLAHELGTPLNSVLGYTQLLLRGDVPEKTRNRLQIIESQVQRMTGIIQHYLSRTRGARDKQPVDINTLVHESLAQLELRFGAHRVQVQQSLADSLPLLTVDGASLQRVFINLFTNAVDAMPAGGWITVTSRFTTPADVAQAGVVVEVQDTGVGIPPDVQSQVFTLFFTTKPLGRGAGLGLAICQEIVKAHGGTITVSSQMGVGTCVRIFLPLASV
jgi:PAS domain S-box-containing protein